ncbi:MAG TPA: 50S ribosomal protein L21 [Nitrospirota bacterium]|nr:50S ribosomal protein L21 [Nitrospirota bacterium]HKZ71902.1 50S ribosomal protein L21 [Nitrospirota bacterium]
MNATAVVETGGKQHRVAVGDVIAVEKIPGAPGDAVELDKVLSVGQGGDIVVGRPYVENAKVIASIVRQERAKKVIIFKKKRRKNYKRTKGHRQYLTRLKIVEVRG